MCRTPSRWRWEFGVHMKDWRMCVCGTTRPESCVLLGSGGALSLSVVVGLNHGDRSHSTRLTRQTKWGFAVCSTLRWSRTAFRLKGPLTEQHTHDLALLIFDNQWQADVRCAWSHACEILFGAHYTCSVWNTRSVCVRARAATILFRTRLFSKLTLRSGRNQNLVLVVVRHVYSVYQQMSLHTKCAIFGYARFCTVSAMHGFARPLNISLWKLWTYKGKTRQNEVKWGKTRHFELLLKFKNFSKVHSFVHLSSWGLFSQKLTKVGSLSSCERFLIACCTTH